jgi:serine/threonine protein kinase/Tfp pilus assembly protein PilF
MIGKTISHYKIVEKLGSGGMGIVYKAQDLKLDRHVALKFLPPHLTTSEEEKHRFIHEAKAASSLDHNNICAIHEIDETEDGQLFISMSYYEGATLNERIKDKPLPIEEAIDITIQIVQGLTKAHEKEIVHRDIKPANIMLTKEGVVKVLDFGLAKLATQTKLTKDGTALGTIAYMSPEQARGDEVDHRTDIWSLGVIMYEMVTGQLPFRGEYEQAVVFSILNEEPEPEPSMHTECERIINKALAKNPEERYSQVEEILKDLKSLRKTIKSELSQKQSKKKSVPSIAVLPFVNISADPEQEYFCDGMAEELINALTKIENLHVPARTSAFVFKGQKVDIREIGRRLNVEHVLEGSVRKAGNRLRITSQLIKVDNGYHLWSERFDRELDDVFVVQDEIAVAIVDRLKVRLLSSEKEKLGKRYTENLEAYSLYLKGLYYWNSISPEAWAKSYKYYQQAIAIDPNYALAYVGLAIWHTSQMFWGDTHPREAVSKGTEQLVKANTLDDTIADAHSGLGIMYGLYEWNRPKAEREFQKSIELGPKSAFVHLNFALFLAVGKSFDKALLHAKKVHQLDPLSSLMKGWAASVMTYAGQYEESIIQFQQIIAEDPQFWQPHYNLSVAYIYQDKFKDAISAAEEAVRLSGGASVAKTFLGCVYALDGQREKAMEQLNELLERNLKKYVPFTFFILLYNSLEETDEAYRWLEKATQDHDPWLCFYGIFPRSLRASEPRFNDLIKANGLVV